MNTVTKKALEFVKAACDEFQKKKGEFRLTEKATFNVREEAAKSVRDKAGEGGFILSRLVEERIYKYLLAYVEDHGRCADLPKSVRVGGDKQHGRQKLDSVTVYIDLYLLAALNLCARLERRPLYGLIEELLL